MNITASAASGFCCSHWKYLPLKTSIRCVPVWFPSITSTHNSTSFICNICLEPPTPTQTQHPGNQPCGTHNQLLQHNSALVLCLSLHPPSPTLRALFKWDPLTAGRTPMLSDDTDHHTELQFPCTYTDFGPVALTYLPGWQPLRSHRTLILL